MYTVVAQRQVPAPVEKVWDYLTKPELLAKWFADTSYLGPDAPVYLETGDGDFIGCVEYDSRCRPVLQRLSGKAERGKAMAQPRNEVGVLLDGDDVGRASQELRRQASGAGPDLEHGIATRDAQRIGDAAEYAGIE